MTKLKETLSPVQLKDDILVNEVPQLGSYMGQIYQNAVATCLDGTLGVGGGVNSMQDRFEEKVVQPLAKCLALYPDTAQAHP